MERVREKFLVNQEEEMKTEMAEWDRCELQVSWLNGVKQRPFALIQCECYRRQMPMDTLIPGSYCSRFLITLLCLQLIDGNQRREELNTQVQIEPALNFSDLYFRLIILICLGSVSWWPELFSQQIASKRGLLHDHVIQEQGELHHAAYNAVGQMYPAMSRADLNCARNFYNEWGLYWLRMTLRKLSATAILTNSSLWTWSDKPVGNGYFGPSGYAWGMGLAVRLAMGS